MIDHRELSSTLVPELRSFGRRIEITSLPVGDIAIGDIVLIERKTARDLLDSLIDGRLFSQARRLMAAAPRPLLVIEGADGVLTRAVHSNSVSGVMASLSIDLGLTIIPTADARSTARLVEMITRRQERQSGRCGNLLSARLKASEEGRIEGVLDRWTEINGSGGGRITFPAGRRLIDDRNRQRRVGELARNLASIKGVGPMTSKRIAETLIE